MAKIITQSYTIGILLPPSVVRWNDEDKVTGVAVHTVEWWRSSCTSSSLGIPGAADSPSHLVAFASRPISPSFTLRQMVLKKCLKNDLINRCPGHDCYHFMSILFIPLKGLFARELKVPTWTHNRGAVSKFLIHVLEYVYRCAFKNCMCGYVYVYFWLYMCSQGL